MLKKIILSFLAFLAISFSFSSTVMAASEDTWYNQSFQEWHNKVYDTTNPTEIFGERYTAAQVQWIFYSILSIMMHLPGGAEMTSCMTSAGGDLKACGQTMIDTMQKIVKPEGSSEILNSNNPLALISSQPISFIGYVRDIGQNWHLIPEANAQGFGFTAASPVLNIWRATRNMSFALLTVVIVVMALMIMFRVRISPQVVITVQAALPRVIIAMVLISFSYAIAGLLIDLMYVVIGLLTILISQAGMTSEGPFELFKEISTTSNVFFLLAGYWIYFVAVSFITILTFNPFKWIVSFVLIIFSVISIFVLLWNTIRIIIMLIRNFAMIILSIISAPFEILLGTIMPGMGISSWIRRMLSYLAVYPVMAMMFILAFYFLYQGIPDWFPDTPLAVTVFGLTINQIKGVAWDPPLTLGTVFSADYIWIIISFVIVSAIPKTAEIIQGFISGRPFAFGTAIGETIAPIMAPVNLAVTGGKNAVVQGFQNFAASRASGIFKSSEDKKKKPSGPVITSESPSDSA